MRFRSAVLLVAAALGVWGVLRAQRPFKQYQAAEYEDFPLPPDWDNKTEWTRARLQYPSVYANRRFGSRSELDHRLSALGPASAPGRAPADADRHAIGGAGRRSRRHRRRLQLADDVRGRGRALGAAGRSGGTIARVSAARRIPDGRRFPRRRTVPGRRQRMAGVSRQHDARCFPDRPIVDSGRLRPDLSHDLRSGRALPGGRLAVDSQRADI